MGILQVFFAFGTAHCSPGLGMSLFDFYISLKLMILYYSRMARMGRMVPMHNVMRARAQSEGPWMPKTSFWGQWAVSRKFYRSRRLQDIWVSRYNFMYFLAVSSRGDLVIYSLTHLLNDWVNYWVTYWFWNIRQAIGQNLWPPIGWNKRFETILEIFDNLKQILTILKKIDNFGQLW